MFSNKRIFLLFFFSISLILSGCYSQNELNNLMIVTAIGIDQTDSGYEVTVQVLNPSEIAGASAKTTRPTISTFTSEGETLFLALKRLHETTSRTIFLGHIRVAVFSEAVSKTGVNTHLEYLLRHHELRNDFALLVAKQTDAKTILQTLSPIEQIPANNLLNGLVATEENYGSAREVEIEDFYQKFLSPGVSPIMNSVEIIGGHDEGAKMENVETTVPDNLLKIGHIAVFDEDRLLFHLTEKESIGFNILTNHIKKTAFVVNVDGYTYNAEATNQKTEITLADEKLSFTIETNISMTLERVQQGEDISEHTLLKVKSALEREVNDYVDATLTKLIQHEVDAVGFGEIINKSAPEFWGEIETEWQDLFKTIHTQLKTEVTVMQTGQ